MRFDPAEYAEGPLPVLSRPKFLAIVSSNTLATTMLKRANGRVDGLIIETQTAGGHNAPPRGKLQLSAAGEPVYGERDHVRIEDLRTLGVPFWMAGGYGSAQKLREALDQGAAGIQVGTAFEFADESGLRLDYKQALLTRARNGSAEVFTDPLASPTGFPFKVAQLDGTSSDPVIYAERTRICNLGFLRDPSIGPNGNVVYRCSAEPVGAYVAKGGKIEDTVGRKCLCNALMANIGHPQLRPVRHLDQSLEPALVTAGDDLEAVAQFLPPGQSTYTAADVVQSLLGDLADQATETATAEMHKEPVLS
jgi:nitronate monooxygenase